MPDRFAKPKDAIVANGERELRAAVRPKIEAEVLAEYQEELLRAGIFRRLIIKHRIRREIRRRLHRAVPPHALY